MPHLSGQPLKETSNFVEPLVPTQSSSNMLYKHLSQHQNRRHSEVILPSIEGGPLGVRKPRSIKDAYHPEIDRLTLGSRTNTLMVPKAIAPEYHSTIYDGSQHTKKRRFYDQQPPTDDERHHDTDMPLDDKCGLQTMGEQHYNVPRDYGERQPSPRNDKLLPISSDRRIVQLTSRGPAGYHGNQASVQTSSHTGLIEHSLNRFVQNEHHFVPRPSVGALRQPQSPSHSVFTQPVYDHESPVVLDAPKSTWAYHGGLNSSSTLRPASETVAADGRDHPRSYAIMQYPQRSALPIGETQDPFQHLAIDGRRGRPYDLGMRGDPKMERVKLDPAQEMRTSLRPQRDIYRSGTKDGHQHRPTDQGIESDGQYVQRNLDPLIGNPFTRHPTQNIQGISQNNWLDL